MAVNETMAALKYIVELGDNASFAVYLFIAYKVLELVLQVFLLVFGGIGATKLIRYLFDNSE